MRTYSVVTTFNKQGLHNYGQRFIDSWAQKWPKEVTLYVYAEDCLPKVEAENIIVKDFHAESADLVAFKTKWKDVPKANGDVSADPVRSKRRDAGKGFKWDAVRFSHKVYSIFHCAEICDTDVLIWMDADTFCHSTMPITDLENIITKKSDLCYVGRERKWPECGVYSINLKSKGGIRFLKEFKWVYDNAEDGIFKMAEWHDSYVFEEVRKKVNPTCTNWGAGLIRGEGHPIINSVWGKYIDHLKGARKQRGKSLAKDLLQPRDEYYWKNLDGAISRRN